jgi:hypothetical protein
MDAMRKMIEKIAKAERYMTIINKNNPAVFFPTFEHHGQRGRKMK